MKDFLVLLISFTLVGCADSVASLFFNLISIDAIVVIGTLTTIGSFALKISFLGNYIYRVRREDEGACALVNFASSAAICLIIFIFQVPIFSLFGISEAQFALLYEVLPFFLVSFVVKMCGKFFLEALRLRNFIKLYNIALVIYYGVYLSGGLICTLWLHSIQSLLVMELLANLFLVIYGTVILKSPFSISRSVAKDIVKIGLPCCAEQMLYSGNVLVYGVLASHMSETFYAIHTVCFSARNVGLSVSSAWNTVIMIKGKEDDAGKNNIKFYDDNMKRFSLVLLLFGVGLTVFAGVIQHGSLALVDIFPYILFYGVFLFGNSLQETYRAACMLNNKVGILVKGTSIFAWIIPLLPLATLLLVPSLDLYMFSISVGLTAAIRGLYSRRELIKCTQDEGE